MVLGSELVVVLCCCCAELAALDDADDEEAVPPNGFIALASNCVKRSEESAIGKRELTSIWLPVDAGC